MSRAVALRALSGAWLVPAASLIWVGLATAGLRSVEEGDLALTVGRIQAVSLLLGVFTLLFGASVYVRRAVPVAPASTSPGRTDRSPGPGWLAGHVVLLAVVPPLVVLGALVESVATLLWPLAALAAFAGGLVLPRALLRFPEGWSGPMAALATGVVFQLTIGWLHVVHPTGLASPALVAEGLILAWAAASAARVDPFATPAPAPTGAEAADDTTRPRAEVSSRAAGGPPFSRASAPPSFAEPAVGR